MAGYIGSLRYQRRRLPGPGRRRRAALAAGQGRALRRRFPSSSGSFLARDAVVLPYVGYDDYAAAVGTLAPDILVAPLDASRTSMSKCPNKYLEYSIAGAAGVYSDTPPYSQTIVDGRTGLLVAGDDEASWSAAIARLVEDAPLRQSIAAAARRDVLERFETGVVAPAFARPCCR